MRKAITTVLAAGLIVGAFMAPAADAGKKRYKRTATSNYRASHGAGDVAVGCLYAAENCGRFATSPKDKYVQITATDQLGTDIYMVVSQPDSNGDGFTERLGTGCGKTTKLSIAAPGQEIIVYTPGVGSFLNSCPGPASTGTLKAVFTNR